MIGIIFKFIIQGLPLKTVIRYKIYTFAPKNESEI